MDDAIATATESAADLGMILGPCLGYIMQTVTMVQTNEADGFSTLVTFILLVSNLIRVFWWYSERFSNVIFVASVVMIFCQIALIYMWVKIQNTPRKDKTVKTFTESFWHWKSFTSYAKAIGGITLTLSVTTFFCHEQEWFSIVLGTLSSGIEALLAVPQFWLNCQRGHTTGLAMTLIFMWFFGDLYKMSYYQSTGSPLQLVLCALFQCTTDCAILAQFWIYRKKNAEIQAKAAAINEKSSKSKTLPTVEKTGKQPSIQRINELLAQATALTSMGDEAPDLDTLLSGWDTSLSLATSQRPYN